MKFLILVPTLNSYKLLPKLVESLKKQIFKEWRVIFVDGNSKEKHISYIKNICNNDSRFEYIIQSKNSSGIYGAMNEGFRNVSTNEWLLFLGSDDWLASNDVLFKINKLNKKPRDYHFLLGNAVYVENENVLLRNSFFNFFKSFNTSLFLGSTPAHQGTLYSYLLNKEKFNEEYKLAADLEYFLRISKLKDLNLFITNQVITYMSNGGVSQKYVFLRIKEVIKAYYKHYGFVFFIPFFLRYSKRLISLFN